MTTCATCQHWQSFAAMWAENGWVGELGGHDEPIIHEAGTYAEVRAPGEWGHCQLVGKFGPASTDARFYVVDGSRYRADLGTRSDFGCNQHEPITPN